jgi:hypothetical protein
VERLFVFDSFDEEIMRNIDMTQSTMGNSMLAFPPLEDVEMMDMHLNVVVNDLAVSIFRDLEAKIMASDAVSEKFVAKAPQGTFKGSLHKILQGDKNKEVADAPTQPTKVSLGDMAAFVSPKSKLAKETRSRGVSRNTSFTSDLRNVSNQATDAASTPKLLTPLDQFHDMANLSPRDVDEYTRRDLARREKWAADFSLMAGSPLDAYERYLRAAEMCRTGTPDPLWYAAALEGCAAAHIAMAEAGGYGVDDYLEQFQMPDEIMALAKEPRQQSGNHSRQTLPEVVFALCEEALNITNRHEKLAPLHAELLLKLADYVAISAESHLRCRWGEGPGCFVGELGDTPRWEKTSIFKMTFSEPKTKDGSGDMININTFNRTKQVCELLQEAVSVGSLNPTTRVDVAARCARLCLDGVRATQWKGRVVEQVRLPRKAAFFAVVAAETMTISNSAKSATAARDLWLLATRLYSKNGNSLSEGGSYGWATLRATALDALSAQGNTPMSNQAALDLLVLLSELQPKVAKTGQANSVIPAKSSNPTRRESILGVRRQSKAAGSVGFERQNKLLTSETSDVSGSKVLTEEGDEEPERNTSSVSTFAKQIRASFAAITPNSTIITLESKWADGQAILPVDVPLSPVSRTAFTIRGLGCVWQSAVAEHCSMAQEECIQRITALRRSLATSSIIQTQNSSDGANRLPVYVSSDMVIDNESNLALERFVTKSKDDADKGAMATFFNPYEKAKDVKMIIVAEEEERTMTIQFGNRLCIPLEVQRCKLIFKEDVNDRVKASALSFVLPSKVCSFVVHFPFSVLADSPANLSEAVSNEFEVAGIELTFLGRVHFIPVYAANGDAAVLSSRAPEVPSPVSIYPLRVATKRPSTVGEPSKPHFEVCPSQPRLQVLFEKSSAPVESVATYSISLADGEMFTLPSLQLKNYSGPTLRGKIERLQILVVDLPGLPETKLFDTDGGHEKSGEAFSKQKNGEHGSVPIRLCALASSLSLDDINSGQICSAGTFVTFQISAANNMKQLMPDGATFRLRFRYRGVASPGSEVWRKHEITYRVTCITGPRISSMEFRPELSSFSSYSDMCHSFAARQALTPTNIETEKNKVVNEIDCNKMFRVGLDKGMHVASREIGFILTIANETKSEISLSRDDGPVGGFQNYPIQSMQVHSGVSAKIPVVIPRISRTAGDGSPLDLTTEIVSKTRLFWAIESSDGTSERAEGQLRIPRDALDEIVSTHPSFVQQVCEAPCTIVLHVGGSVVSGAPSSAPLGSVVDLQAEANVAEWVPKDIVSKCSLTLEFACIRERDTDMIHGKQSSRDHIWAGKLMQKYRMDAKDLKHTARIVFTNPGRYCVSACARIVHDDAVQGVEEIWWAPVSSSFVVDQCQVSQ